VEQSGVELLDEFNQHPSLLSDLADGFGVVTF
jgi:hypothetical protein